MKPNWKDVWWVLFLPAWATIAVEMSHEATLASAAHGLVLIALHGSIAISALLELPSGLLFIKKFRSNYPTRRLPAGIISYTCFFIWTSGGTLVLQLGLFTRIIPPMWEWAAPAFVLAVAISCLGVFIIRLLQYRIVRS